jgi:hypothetical protein
VLPTNSGQPRDKVEGPAGRKRPNAIEGAVDGLEGAAAHPAGERESVTEPSVKRRLHLVRPPELKVLSARALPHASQQSAPRERIGNERHPAAGQEPHCVPAEVASEDSTRKQVTQGGSHVVRV